MLTVQDSPLWGKLARSMAVIRRPSVPLPLCLHLSLSPLTLLGEGEKLTCASGAGQGSVMRVEDLVAFVTPGSTHATLRAAGVCLNT